MSHRWKVWAWTTQLAQYKQNRDRVQQWKKFYTEYEWEKPTWHLFYNRMLKLDKPCEYCIQLKLPKDRETVNQKISESVRKGLDKKVFTNHKIETEKKYNPEYYWVQITYPTIEERINFYQAYDREIKGIQDKIENADSQTDVELIREWNKKLTKLNREFLQFKLLNPLVKTWTQ